ncbi:hypothetical protein LOOC260_102710 [Paucilactobacillus hokkaidonensis JCM 18461]|uniref:Uncharacterized protein n=1 Tax=Paucilactobacillus hokkaidonensis JCM 18461 TaxID=1291742 RepID=A0A0A1GUX7_9LACO|nr:hypothetical protein LOOC260_102710 [Paucilactobacillus hokkaidonensis JCM 18461]
MRPNFKTLANTSGLMIESQEGKIREIMVRLRNTTAKNVNSTTGNLASALLSISNASKTKLISANEKFNPPRTVLWIRPIPVIMTRTNWRLGSRFVLVKLIEFSMSHLFFYGSVVIPT